MSEQGKLAGHVVVVTGAAGGIGTAVAQELADQGAQLTLVGRRSEPLEELRLGLPGGPHCTVAMDVTDERAWESIRERLYPLGGVQGVVTAAAQLTPIGSLGSWDIAEFRRAIDVNLVGTLLPVVALLDLLKMAAGAVVTFSGGGATAPLPRFDAYAASKAAVVRLTENLATDLQPFGVRLNCVAPGFVVTPMHSATLDVGPGVAGAVYHERTRQAVSSNGGDPPQLAAELTAFLLSDAASGITGRLISARWDPWRTENFHHRILRDPHFATLRRIDDQFFTGVPSADP